jgi:hypothetical protein
MGLGDWMVEVMIHLDVKDGARASDLFIKLNRRLPVAPYYKFLNAVEAKEEGALAIVEIAASLQLELTHGSRDGALCCVSVLDRVFNFDKTGTALLVTLQVLVEAWGRTASAMEGKLIEGLGVVFHQYNGTLDRASLVKKLSKYPGGAARLIGDSRGLRELTHTTLAKAVAKQVVEVYNNGRRSGKLDPL